MELSNTFYAANRDEWRKWLELHYKSKKEVWLIYYKKHSGKPRVPYNDAVEEALCFGWIDSTVKRIDKDRYMQKFTPRNKGSNWSDWNVKRIGKMIAEGKVIPEGVELFEQWKKSGKATVNAPKGEIPEISDDFKEALGINPAALDFFETLAAGYRRNYIAWINDAKKEETRKKRIDKAIEMLKKGKKSLM
ncbi:YdeI family protein [Bacteroidota bacterium]